MNKARERDIERKQAALRQEKDKLAQALINAAGTINRYDT